MAKMVNFFHPYFICFIISIGLRSSTGRLDSREKSFDNRLVLMENLTREKVHPMRSTSPVAFSYNPTVSALKPVKPEKKARMYRRCQDPTIQEDELILRGLYRLDETQTKIYEDFARMLSQFDHYDSVCLLFISCCS